MDKQIIGMNYSTKNEIFGKIKELLQPTETNGNKDRDAIIYNSAVIDILTLLNKY